jgi:rhamnosyltransferase
VNVSVIIPTLNAGDRLPGLLAALGRQSLRPVETIVIDSSSEDSTAEVARLAGCRVEVIPRTSFDHGGTRNLAARMASGDAIVFMTQDAMPADEDFLAALVAPVARGEAAATYARQVAPPGSRPTEVFARQFYYPEGPERRTLDDLPRMGMDAFFLSNVAAAVARDAFNSVGGFPAPVIMNEDMLLAAALLRRGYAIAYAAEAVVYHAHQYTLWQVLRRYFDIGASRTQEGGLLAGAAWRGHGTKFLGGLARFLIRHGAWAWLPRAAAESAMKFAGYQLGKRHRWMPAALKRRLSMNAAYWKKRD